MHSQPDRPDVKPARSRPVLRLAAGRARSARLVLAAARRATSRASVIAVVTLAVLTMAGQAAAQLSPGAARADLRVVSSPPPLPCDIYRKAGAPCAAAHSTTRALFSNFNGRLYRVQRLSDKETKDIRVLRRGGYANAAAQDAFCSGSRCVITVLFDQTPNGNHLTVGSGGGTNPVPDRPAVANRLPITAGGHKVYGVWMDPGMGYRDVSTRGVPTGAEPEAMYMVASGTHTNARGPGPASCCFNYGNVQPSVSDEGAATMDAVNFSAGCWPLGIGCRGAGPWVQADLENGVYQSTTGVSTDESYTGDRSPFVTALLRNDGVERFTLKSGNAVTGALNTRYNGPLPYKSQLEAGWCAILTVLGKAPDCDVDSPYRPMEKQGALVMGTGGDNSNFGEGNFYEGVLTVGIPPHWADARVHRNIQSVKYKEGWTR